MKYLLGIDFGGSSSKATLLDTDGRIVCENTVEYKTYYPENGACEQSPSDWISALCENVSTLIKQSGIVASDILGVAIDSATHTFLVADENFTPLRNAIHWTDSRSASESRFLYEKYGDEIFKKTYHKPDTIWTLPQILWLKNNEPTVFEKTKYIFFEKDYIRYFLTDVYCTDLIEAEGSMLFDTTRMEWDESLCALASIDVDMLPPLKRPTDIVGRVTESAAKKTGLLIGTPVICGTTDTVMEVFASGAIEAGDITVKLATAGRICIVSDKPYPDRHIINYSHIIDGLWYPGTATKAAASSYRYYRDTFGGDYSELDKDASVVPVGADGLIFHPYINGELTPYADPLLCGSFTGIRTTHTRGHFTRAVLEGVSLSLLDCKLYFDSLGATHKSIATLIGGGAKGELWRQITADVLGMTLRVTESSDSSLGSAMLAGVALGVFKDAKDAVTTCIKEKSVTKPNPENTEKYRKIYEKYKRIAEALSPVYHES